MNNLTEEQIYKLALDIALRYHLSDFNDDKPEEVLEHLEMNLYETDNEDDQIIVWEPFENHDGQVISDHIFNLKRDIATTFIEALGEAQ
jgi:hypothetical protein